MEKSFRTLRLKNNLTIKEVAEKLGVKESTIEKYECSGRLPRNDKLIVMKEIFKCDDNLLLDAYIHHKKINLERAERHSFRKKKEGKESVKVQSSARRSTNELTVNRQAQ